MSSSTADAGRALYGISKSGLTIKWLGKLNRYHVPGNAMTVDLVVNTCLILFISSNLAILYMSNIGYVLCHVLAMSAFLLLRKDRPNWPRPIKVSAPWVAMAGILPRCYRGVDDHGLLRAPLPAPRGDPRPAQAARGLSLTRLGSTSA